MGLPFAELGFGAGVGLGPGSGSVTGLGRGVGPTGSTEAGALGALDGSEVGSS